jgi:hypothetical protein
VGRAGNCLLHGKNISDKRQNTHTKIRFTINEIKIWFIAFNKNGFFLCYLLLSYYTNGGAKPRWGSFTFFVLMWFNVMLFSRRRRFNRKISVIFARKFHWKRCRHHTYPPSGN